MVDVPLDAVSISDLARRRGVSKQAIHKRVAALVGAGKLSTFAGPNRSVMVSEAAYDFAVGLTGDPVKEAAAETAAVLRGDSRLAPAMATSAPQSALHLVADKLPAPAEDSEAASFRESKARDAFYGAEMKRLALERETGRIYYIEEVEAALLRIADAVRDQARGLISHADAGAEAFEKGMPAFRRWLSGLGDDLCRSIAKECRMVAADAQNQEAPPPATEDEPTPEA